MTSGQRRYPGKLYHRVPSWVETGAIFHIRIRSQKPNLILSRNATAMLESAEFSHRENRWFVRLFLLMPDHLHALLQFPPNETMSQVVGDWKRYQKTQLRIVWQEGFFDHRIRNGDEYPKKAAYVRLNPVRAELCDQPEEWEWVLEHCPW